MPRGIPKEFESSSRYDYRIGEFVRRKRSSVVYEIIGGLADYSYEPAYNFVRYFVRLRRIDNGRTTSIPDAEFRYSFERA